MCFGRSAGGGVPKWSSGFRMLKKSQVVRLFVKQGQGRPDRFEKTVVYTKLLMQGYMHEHGSSLLLSVHVCSVSCYMYMYTCVCYTVHYTVCTCVVALDVLCCVL